MNEVYNAFVFVRHKVKSRFCSVPAYHFMPMPVTHAVIGDFYYTYFFGSQ